MTRMLKSAGMCLLAGALALTGCKGADGKDGKNGVNCTVAQGADSATITCTDGTTATVDNGAAGAAGVSCSVAQDVPSTGYATVTCGTGGTATTAVLPPGVNGTNGTNGADGASCTMQVDYPASGQNTITCGTATAVVTNGANGTNGADGASCWVQPDVPVANEATITCGTGATATTAVIAVNECVITTNADSTRTITCGTGTSVTVQNGATVNFATMSAAEKTDLNMAAAITDVTVLADGRPRVTLKVSDRKGNGVRGITTANATWRFAILQLTPDVNGSANGTWVNYNGDAGKTASTETASATTLADTGDGNYQFTFTRSVNQVLTGMTSLPVTYDQNAIHRVVVILYASGNPFAPVNLVKDFIPATGADVPVANNEKADEAACLECHKSFRAPANGTGAFHSGARYALPGCVACHNDQRRFTTLSATTVGDAAIQADGSWTGNLAIVNGEGYINIPVFIHKIHMGKDLTLTGITGSVPAGGTYPGLARPYEVTYPQSPTMCAKCHRTVGQASNWSAQPSRRACGACHDGISFLGTAPNARVQHTGGACATDADCGGSACLDCHTAGTSDGIAERHALVIPPDPNNVYLVPEASGGNKRTNAAYLASSAAIPAGAAIIGYDIQSVSRNGSNQPVIVFRLTRNGTPVVFDTYAAGVTEEMMAGFVGAPNVYFAYAVPQDNITAPADFNVTANVYLKSVWNGAVTTSTLTYDAGTGYYTLTMTNVVVPTDAVMLTGGLGYNYDLLASQPLTQTDLAAFPYDTGTRVGGLLVPVTNKVVTATGFTARRTIVSNAACNKCHAALGVAPTFHVGQRNDAPTCSFCHNVNRVNAGWAVNAKEIIHNIHAAGVRAQPFNWDQISATEGFFSVTYPGKLASCEQCHTTGAYYFTSDEETTLVPNLLPSTVATGTYAAGSTHSPWVAEATAYGTAFAFATATGVTTPASGTTLVVSPITAACSTCHDSTIAIWHMQDNGGQFYAPRSSALPSRESCLVCHGQGKYMAIEAVHAQ